MAVRAPNKFEEQTGITTLSDHFMITPNLPVNVAVILTAGSPVNGAKIMVTLDEPEKVKAGTALWVDSPMGRYLTSNAEAILQPITAVCVSVTDGTWTIQVRQA